MHILGINCAYHESSACLLRDGVILAAVEEERFTRRKHAKPSSVDNPDQLPVEAIRFCLETAGVDGAAIEHVGFSMLPERRLENKNLTDRVVEGSWGSVGGEEEFFRRLGRVPSQLEAMGIHGQFHWLSHHLCHAASAYYTSSFEQAAVLTVDGIGEIGSTHLAHGRGNRLAELGEVMYPASIGFLWEKLSKFLGFGEYDACKVMGLAAYGTRERFLPRFRQVVEIQNGSFRLDSDVLCFRVEDYAPLERLFGVARRQPSEPLEAPHKDLAAALQAVTDEVLLHLAETLHEKTGSPNLCIAGGVGLNCVTNNFLLENSPFEKLCVQPAAHDAGTALGAAAFIWHGLLDQPRLPVDEPVYLGPSFSDDEIERALTESGLVYRRIEDIEVRVAAELAEGHVVGWFQGRMEFGPRALGNRSLLADPRDPEVRELLNVKVKHREVFRPFAPSVLDEEADAWFDIPGGTCAAEYMLLACPAREAAVANVPAVVHVDGTSRVQRVRRERNQRYHRLISEFFRLTEVPIVLNTSFNDDEPIVCRPEDAIHTFRKTDIDYLAIGDFLVDRKEQDFR